jgi:hypothetical protein
MAHADIWASAIGAWVPLANLLSVIEQETSVSPDEAARVLREPLESCNIDAEVVNSSGPFDYRCNSIYAKRVGLPDPDRLSPQDWRHVDWAAGTLGGHTIRVRWTDVIEQLRQVGLSLPSSDRKLTALAAQNTAKQNATERPRGGAPPRHDWDAFWIEVALYAAKHDIDPARRRDLQQHMVEWATGELQDHPDEATIRARLRRLYQRVAGGGSEV